MKIPLCQRQYYVVLLGKANAEPDRRPSLPEPGFPDSNESSQSDNGTVALITNFFDELKRLVPTDP